MQVMILSGISGSGKSTFANGCIGPKTQVVSRDKLREQYFSSKKGVLPFQDEERITILERKKVLRLLELNKNVIIDDTNLRPKYIKEWIGLIQYYVPDATIHIQSFYDEDVNECIKRDKEREDSVGEEVIRRQYQMLKSNRKELEKIQSDLLKKNVKEFVLPKGYKMMTLNYPKFVIEPYSNPTNLPKCVWVDVDGTLAKCNNRDIYDLSKVYTDLVYEDVKFVVNCLAKSGVRIIIMSGREESAQTVTEQWLADNEISYDEIHMRPLGDRRGDDIIKYELFNSYIRDKYYCLGVFDDRPRVSRVAEELGLTVFKLGPLDFEF